MEQETPAKRYSSGASSASRVFFSNPAELAFSALDLKLFLKLVSEYRALARDAQQKIELLANRNTALQKELADLRKQKRRVVARATGPGGSRP